MSTDNSSEKTSDPEYTPETDETDKDGLEDDRSYASPSQAINQYVRDLLEGCKGKLPEPDFDKLSLELAGLEQDLGDYLDGVSDALIYAPQNRPPGRFGSIQKLLRGFESDSEAELDNILFDVSEEIKKLGTAKRKRTN